MGTNAEPAMQFAEGNTTWRLPFSSIMAYASLVLAVLATLSIPAILALFAIIRTLYFLVPLPDISSDYFIVPITGALGLVTILSGSLSLVASHGIQPRPQRSMILAGIAVALAVLDLCVVLIILGVGWKISLESLLNR